MSDINNENRLRKKSAPSYSEIPSGYVHPSILGSATDTAQTFKDADANIAIVTERLSRIFDFYLSLFLDCTILRTQGTGSFCNVL